MICILSLNPTNLIFKKINSSISKFNLMKGYEFKLFLRNLHVYFPICFSSYVSLPYEVKFKLLGKLFFKIKN